MAAITSAEPFWPSDLWGDIQTRFKPLEPTRQFRGKNDIPFELTRQMDDTVRLGARDEYIDSPYDIDGLVRTYCMKRIDNEGDCEGFADCSQFNRSEAKFSPSIIQILTKFIKIKEEFETLRNILTKIKSNKEKIPEINSIRISLASVSSLSLSLRSQAIRSVRNRDGIHNCLLSPSALKIEKENNFLETPEGSVDTVLPQIGFSGQSSVFVHNTSIFKDSDKYQCADILTQIRIKTESLEGIVGLPIKEPLLQNICISGTLVSLDASVKLVSSHEAIAALQGIVRCELELALDQQSRESPDVQSDEKLIKRFEEDCSRKAEEMHNLMKDSNALEYSKDFNELISFTELKASELKDFAPIMEKVEVIDKRSKDTLDALSKLSTQVQACVDNVSKQTKILKTLLTSLQQQKA